MRRKPVLLLTLAVAAYIVAAWSVTPGFYDGFTQQQPYRWTNPPPAFKNSNQPPLSGRAQAKVAANGLVDPGTAATDDGQASTTYAPGAFVAPADRSPVTVNIAPVSRYPDPTGLQLATNVYCFTASAALAPGKDLLITLTYSDQQPAPGDVYGYRGQGPWQKLGSTGSAAPFTISVRSAGLGCFAGAYPAKAAQNAQGALLGGGQTLPIVVAAALLILVLAGVPLALLRRRDGPAQAPPCAGGPSAPRHRKRRPGGRR